MDGTVVAYQATATKGTVAEIAADSPVSPGGQPPGFRSCEVR